MPNFDRYVHTLYHFTDAANLESIVANGGLYSWKRLQTLGIAVPVPGGNDWSHDADARSDVDNYVHLCLKNEHPMEWVARREGRLTDPIFLKISPEVLEFDGVLFTADVSNKVGVPRISRTDANELFDFEVLFERTDWRNPEIQDRMKRAKKCEVLIPDSVPLEFVMNLQEFGY